MVDRQRQFSGLSRTAITEYDNTPELPGLVQTRYYQYEGPSKGSHGRNILFIDRFYDIHP